MHQAKKQYANTQATFHEPWAPDGFWSAPVFSHLYLKIFVLDIFAVNLHSVRSDRGRED